MTYITSVFSIELLTDDIDFCSHDDNACSEYASCMNDFDGYKCVCNDGYVGDGFDCDGLSFF